MKNCQNSWRINSWAQFSGAINLKKVDTKENTGTLKVALRPQREMVDKPSSGLDEIQLRTLCVTQYYLKGLLCLYILKKVEIWASDTDPSLTQTTEYSATQLI